MKIFSGQKNPNLTPREIAQGCLTANLAIPGLGSVIAGRKVGLVQLAIYFLGFALTLIFGVSFVLWALSHWSQFYGEFNRPDSDPSVALADLWHRTRWALLGIVLFAVSWLWALWTSRDLLAETRAKTGEITSHETKN